MTLGDAINEVVLGIQDRTISTDELAERALAYMGGLDPKTRIPNPDPDRSARGIWAAVAKLTNDYSWSSFAMLAGNRDCSGDSPESVRYDAFKVLLIKSIRDFWTAWLDDRKGMSA